MVISHLSNLGLKGKVKQGTLSSPTPKNKSLLQASHGACWEKALLLWERTVCVLP